MQLIVLDSFDLHCRKIAVVDVPHEWITSYPNEKCKYIQPDSEVDCYGEQLKVKDVSLFSVGTISRSMRGVAIEFDRLLPRDTVFEVKYD